MDFQFAYFMLGDSRLFVFAFFLVGLAIYFVDFKYFKDQEGYQREATFSRMISRLYIYGSILVFVSLEIMNMFLV